MAIHIGKTGQGLIFFLSVSLLLYPCLTKANPTELEQVVSRLQTTYEGIRDLSARFVQISWHQGSGSKEESTGNLMMKKPGMMRWEYKSPESRSIVCDGKSLFIYSPADRQVIVQEAPAAFSSLAVDFLTGMGDLSKDFRIGWGRPEEKVRKGSLLLELQPIRQEVQIRRILMEIDPETYLVERMVLKDAYSNTTQLSFKRVHLNTGLQDSLFAFVPPPGVEVIQGFPGVRKSPQN
ncbi:MAG: outer membrane lipoprotein chaperone LolA [candidate division NC10 bacterium]|nr:outer membrane lipoprotein chaperone LolA [candidate division NC10 bacterium]